MRAPLATTCADEAPCTSIEALTTGSRSFAVVAQFLSLSLSDRLSALIACADGEDLEAPS